MKLNNKDMKAGFKRGLGIKETLGLGYEEFKIKMGIDYEIGMMEEDMEIIKKELVERGEELREIMKGIKDWNISLSYNNNWGSIEIEITGKVSREENIEGRTDELGYEVMEMINELDIVMQRWEEMNEEEEE
jgi:hypothetical protein